jgi:hypothetical protein
LLTTSDEAQCLLDAVQLHVVIVQDPVQLVSKAALVIGLLASV